MMIVTLFEKEISFQFVTLVKQPSVEDVLFEFNDVIIETSAEFEIQIFRLYCL